MSVAHPSSRRFLDVIAGTGVESETEMAINRIAILTTLFAAAIAVNQASGAFDLRLMSSLYLANLASAIGLIAHINTRPNARIARRIYAMAFDICLLSYVSYVIGPVAIGFLYPPYLLIIYGYGFRFGLKWLIAASALSVVCMSIVIAAAPDWRADGFMAAGLLVGLILTPAYAHKLVGKLWQAKAMAEESSRAKSMFIAAVSHDLRTPLNAIIGLGDILAATKGSADEADMARMIGDAGRSLLGQIDSIIDYSRLEMGRDRVKIEEVDLIAMLCGLRELLGVSAQARNIRLSLTLDMPVPRLVSTSARHIRDVLTNLVGNAIKFTTQGSVIIHVAAVGASAGKTRLRFEVRDTGIGIKPSDQKNIFDKFSQANDRIRGDFGGSGLGLAICRELVQALGGRIGVVSAEGEGSIFWFEVDVGLVEYEAAAAQSRTSDAIIFSADPELIAAARAAGGDMHVEMSLEALQALCARPGDERLPPVILDTALCAHEAAGALDRVLLNERLSRGGLVVVASQDQPCCKDGCAAGSTAIVRRPVDARTMADALYLAAGAGVASASRLGQSRVPPEDQAILVVEDNKTNQKVIARMLAMAGRRATVVADGRMALERLESERFDIVLMDINMPGIDGVEATRRLRASETSINSATPVIALTADVTPETRARCLEAGIDDCVIKPIDRLTLLAVLDRWTARRLAPSDTVASADAPCGAASGEAGSKLSLSALADLEALGGRDFVREVADQFVDDAALLLAALAEAVRDGDLLRFRDEAHALRSCSANVGARSIYDLCLSWREIGPDQFIAEGARNMALLEREYAAVRDQLAPYRNAA